MSLDLDSIDDDAYNVDSLSIKVLESVERQESHAFQLRFFHKPVLCVHCMDYIWGAGYIGYMCAKCLQCVHFKCLIFVGKQAACERRTDAVECMDTVTKPNPYPIENWSNELVKQWLAVVNLHRYAEVFAKYSITGSKLLALNSEQLYEYRIRDAYHHRAILDCCKELMFKARHYSTQMQMFKEQNEFINHLKANPYKASRHHFLLHTVSQQQSCAVCARLLLGIVHQGLICQNCGIMVRIVLFKYICIICGSP